ncbi:MAG: DUF1015 domain-containing protein, partial [Promethearchaeota archaeon]
SIFLYRQESPDFSQQGLIMGSSLEDYDNGKGILKHEYTRAKPLADRTKHITTTHMAAGLVWTVFRSNEKINSVMDDIKKREPLFDFQKYGYRQILWKESDPEIIQKLKVLFKNEKLYIADGHHRCASANEYRKLKLKEGKTPTGKEPWEYLLNYVSSDDQIKVMAYNRIIRKLPISEEDFLHKLNEVYCIKPVNEAFNPKEKHEVALFCKGKWYKLDVKSKKFANIRDSLDVAILQDKICKGKWYKLDVKSKKFANIRDSLDVAILQDKIFSPVLGIEDPRTHKNIFFVGGLDDPKEMEKYVTEQGNDLFFNLYAVDIRDLEAIADVGGVMPPKSTWFDPKVLSGLVIYNLDD